MSLLVVCGISTFAFAKPHHQHEPPESVTRPTLSGIAREREMLVVDEGTWSSSTPMRFSYQWLRCWAKNGHVCVVIPQAQSKTYILTAADVGHRVRARVFATNAYGTEDRRSSASDPVVWAPPRNVNPPALLGSGRESEPLTVSLGTWDGIVTMQEVVWHRCDATGCLPMGITANSYTPTFADVGSRISIEVIASGPGGSASATSAEVEIRAMPPVLVALPQIQGEAREGVTLTADPGSWQWTVDRFEYAWLACDPSGDLCAPISGAGNSTWTPSFADVGARIRVQVTAIGPGGLSQAVSAPTDPVLYGPPRLVSPPVISGVAREHETLSAAVGQWEGAVDRFEYQWLACDGAGATCLPLSGETGQSVAVDSAWVGRTLRVQVTAIGPGGSALSVSEATAPILLAPPVNTAPPAISGIARDGEVLSASTGTWAGTVTDTHYQWLRCDSAGQNCQPVGTDAATYRLVPRDVSSTIRVQVTASNSEGSGSAMSAPTAEVVGTPPSVRQAPWIAGVLTVGQVLSGGRGEWSGTAPLAWQYQWVRCDALGAACTPISGATALRYAITAADVGHALRLEVTASNGAGTLTATSPSSGEVRSGYAQEVLADAPVGYWRFGETGGTTAFDSSGSNANGTLFGGASLGKAGALPDGNRAASFDGVSGRVDMGDRFDFPGNSRFTFEAWIRPTVVDAWHRRIIEKEEKNAAGQWEGYRLAINSSLGVYCERWQNGNNAGLTSAPISLINIGSWNHVACTYDGASIRMYVNGVLAATKAAPTLVAVTSAPFTIGSFSGGGSASWFAGDLDEVAVYASALSATRLQAHVNAALATAPVAFAAPAIEGQPVPGRILTGSTGTWRGALPVAFAWQWVRCDPNGGNCSDILGATGAQYRVTDDDIGSRLAVRVTASNSKGAQTSVSAATDVVSPVTPVSYCVEAENGTLSGVARVYAGPAETVGGTVVLGPQGTGELAIPFSIPEAQPVTIWARVRAQTRSNHALRVTLAEEGFSSNAIWDIPISPVLRWQRVTRRGAGGTETLPAESTWPGTLSGGAHTLLLQGEEPGVEIDAVCVSTVDAEPEERLPEAPVRTVTRSVADFGAVGDGVTDDTAALQAALDALNPGEALLVPAGRYRFTSTLTLNRHEVSVVGVGPASVLFADLPATATGNAINIAGGFEGKAYPLQADALETDREVRVDSTAPLAVGDVVLLSEDEWGPPAPNLTTLFYRNRAHLVTVTEARLDGSAKVLTLDRPLQSEFRLAHNAVAYKFNGLRGVVLSNLRIEGTANPVSTDNADTNLVLVNRCVRCFFSDLELSHARKSAIEVGRALDSSVIRVHVSDATDTGGNGHGYGIAVTRSQGVIVRDSLFDGVLRHGVPISWGSRETFVYRNVFDRSTPQSDKLASVDIHGQDDYGNLVEDNLITGGDEALIVGGGGTSHGNDGPWNVLRRNRVENAVDAISVYKSSFHTVIDQNTVTGSTRYPVRVESGSHDALIWSNRIDGYVGSGVRVVDSDRAEIRNNEIVPGSGPAVQLSNSTGYVVTGNALGGETISHPGTGTVADNF